MIRVFSCLYHIGGKAFQFFTNLHGRNNNRLISMPGKHVLIPLFITCIYLAGCNTTSTEKPEKPVLKNHDIKGVSVWDRISARAEPSRDASRASLLSLGESFLYLDTFAIDSSNNNTKFLKARLSDSSVVWLYDFATVLNASPAAIISEVPLYLRPDLLTITEKRMQPMEIVAVMEEWNDWIKIVNEKKEHTGWIKKEFITYKTIDLAFSLLVKRNMETEDTEERIDQLETLLENNPYPNTIFLTELRNTLETERELLRESEQRWERDNDDRRNRDR